MYRTITLFCVLVSLCSAGSSHSCGWIEHKFRQYTRNSLHLLDSMGNHTADVAEAEHGAAFPYALYRRAFRASAEDRLALVAQILDKIAVLFEKENSSASWEESTVEKFVNILIQQVHGLRLCIVNHSRWRKNKRLDMHFKNLSHWKTGHSADAWEMIRTEVRAHLIRADLLVTSVLTAN